MMPTTPPAELDAIARHPIFILEVASKSISEWCSRTALEMRLANLCQANEDARAAAPEGK